MKILIISDTHGCYDDAINLIRSLGKIDAIIHCGDMLYDCRQIDFEFPEIPLYYVLGNNDFGSDEPLEREIILGGKKIFITHGHRYGVKIGIERLRQKASEGYDLIVYGHTHIPHTEYFGKSVILNPGAMSYGRNNYAICEIEGGKLKTTLFDR